MSELRSDTDLVVIEAATAEQALGQVAARLGNNAEIVAVDKVLRGGIGGFFAREQVRISARPGGDPVAAPARAVPVAETGLAPDTTEPAGRPRAALLGVLDQLAAEADAQERSFGEALRSQLAGTGVAAPRLGSGGGRPETASVRPPDIIPAPGAAEVVVPASALVPAPVPALRPAPIPVARPLLDASPGGPAWSQDNLRRLGLPPLVVDAGAGLDERDDLGWTAAVGAAVATLCRPLPTADAVIAGPRAGRLAAAWDLPLVRGGEQPPRRGSFCAPVRDSAQARSWLAWSRGSRWLHLVVGGDRWRELLFDEPLAVTWAGAEHLPEALTLCAQLGLTLGYGIGDARGAQPQRANAVDVAVAVRALLPRR